MTDERNAESEYRDHLLKLLQSQTADYKALGDRVVELEKQFALVKYKVGLLSAGAGAVVATAATWAERFI